MSKIATGFLVAAWLPAIIFIILASSGQITWLQLVYYFSYIKLGIVLIKYIPQVSMGVVQDQTNVSRWLLFKPLTSRSKILPVLKSWI